MSDGRLSNAYRLRVNVIMWHAVGVGRNFLEGSYLEDQEEDVNI
jgi:predicted oxidoreductase